MKKGTSQIEQDIFNVLESFFSGVIGGTVYMQGCRPLDAKTEDVVIAVTSGTADQIQTGRARVNIYVPDIDNNSGTLVPDKERIQELEKFDSAVVVALNTVLFEEYEFYLFEMTDTVKAEGINQHFVNIKLEFERITF